MLADQVKVFDLYVDLSLGAIQDGEEEMVGGFVGLNKDDDNANGVADYLDNGAPWLEDDDLIELRLGLSLYLTNGIFKLEVLEGAEHIRIWEKTNWIIDPLKEVRMPLTNVWDLAFGDPAEYASIEGISTSSIPRDVVLRLSYSNESFYAQDVVKFSVVNVELSPQSTNVCWKKSNQVEILTTNMFSPNGILWTGTNGLAVVSTYNEKLVFTPTNSIPTNYLIKAEVVGLSSCYDTATVTVYRVDLDPASTNVCWNMTNQIEIVVTNSYAPNGIVWSGTNGLAVVSADSTNLVFTPTNSTVTNYAVKAVAVEYTNCFDICEVRVFQVDLDIGAVSDSDEEMIGAFVPVNSDNDNGSVVSNFLPKIRDFNTNSIAGENDLIHLFINVQPSVFTGHVRLRKEEEGRDQIKIWTNAQKTAEVILPKTWDLDTDPLPSILYVEGKREGDAVRQVELSLEYLQDSSVLCCDMVRITVTPVLSNLVAIAGPNNPDYYVSSDNLPMIWTDGGYNEPTIRLTGNVWSVTNPDGKLSFVQHARSVGLLADGACAINSDGEKWKWDFSPPFEGETLVDGEGSGNTWNPFYFDEESSPNIYSSIDRPRIWVGHPEIFPAIDKATQISLRLEFSVYPVWESSATVYFLGKTTWSVCCQGILTNTAGVVSFTAGPSNMISGSSGFIRSNADQKMSEPSATAAMFPDYWRWP